MKCKLLLRRFFASLLLIVVSFFSRAYGFEVDGIYYYVNGSNAIVTSGTSKYSGSVTIPSTVRYAKKTYDVTEIGKYAFKECSDLTSVTIPNSIIYISEDAFNGCI